MTSYTIPIQTALVVFLLLSYVLTIPWLIYNYRKYGLFTWWHSFIVYSFIFYIIAAFALVLLPLPTTRNTCAFQSPDTVYASLVPFSFIRDTVEDAAIVWSQPSTYVRALAQPALLQAIFNFLLLLPFGMYLRYFFRQRLSWVRIFGLSFALSLFFEVTQITGVYGIYTCPYRIFDVDDLLLNSTGALLGFSLAPMVLSVFPSRQSLLDRKEQLLKQTGVLPLVQLLAVAVDRFIVYLCQLLFTSFLISNELATWLSTTVSALVVFFVVPLLWNGRTPGTRLLRFKLTLYETDRSLHTALLVRTLALYLPWLLATLVDGLAKIPLDIDSAFYPVFMVILAGLSVVIFFMWVGLLVHVALVIISKGRRHFYFDVAAHLLPRKS
jgi:glycopeptide antibiotics resistance protein